MAQQNKMKENIGNAIKWSSVTEIATRCIQPVTNMILARLLTPQAFGVVATASMIFSFADMFTDSGFQKYLIQQEFESEEYKYRCANVAFWSNFIFSLFLWGVIALFSEALANLVGNPGLGNVIIISCISLPLTSFSSIQQALYKREFDFKTLFIARIIAAMIPFAITVPFAFLLKNYWALIIGTIAGNLSNAVILTIRSRWKPKLFYSFHLLKKMLSFSIWTLVESISIWMTNYAGTFIVGAYLSTYYVGLYKTSLNTVGQIMKLVTAAVIPVLFAGLARLQKDDERFKRLFFQFQKKVSLILMPMGFGLFLYRSLVTKVLLGNQWEEVTDFIGMWGLAYAFSVVTCYFCSEVYRAKGRPKLSTIAQIIYLAVLVPGLVISSKTGFYALCITTTGIGVFFAVIHAFIMGPVMKISPLKMLKNIMPSIICSIGMYAVGSGLQLVSSSMIWSFLSIGICAAAYFMILRVLFTDDFNEISAVLKPFLKKVWTKKYFYIKN